MGSIRNKNNWNNASKRLFGSYSHSGIPGFPFRLFYSQEQNSRNIFRNIFWNKFLFRNIPNERALRLLCQVTCKKAEMKKCVIRITAIDARKGSKNTSFYQNIKVSRFRTLFRSFTTIHLIRTLFFRRSNA